MALNGLHDPSGHKRTSIHQLLNPVAASPNGLDSSSYPQSNQFQTFASPSGSLPPQHVQQPYPDAGPPGSSFSLRAASWDHGSGNETLDRRRVEEDQMLRGVRPGLEQDGHFGMEGVMWPQPPEGHAVQYGNPAITPLYSDERTVIQGDHASKDHFTQQQQQEYHQAQTSVQYQPPPGTLQISERASVRLAARATAEPSPQARFQAGPFMPAYPTYVFGAIPMAPPHHVAQIEAGPSSPYLQQQPKRPAEEVEEEPQTKPKKSRAKPNAANDVNAPGASKRGFNKKRRAEAAKIQAHNAQFNRLVPSVHISDDKQQGSSSGANPLRLVPEEGTRSPDHGPLHPELQFARCMSNRYKSEQFPRCVSCTRRWAGDTCRFQGIRFFLKDENRNMVGISFMQTMKPDGPNMKFPDEWNVKLEPKHIRRVKRTVANSLLPTLKQELKHLSGVNVIRRPRESDVRATCDTCMTSIFSCSWMCRVCGREACGECFEQVQELTSVPTGAPDAEVIALQAKREKHAHANPFFLSCTRRNEHSAGDFSPVSRFCGPELEQAIKEMEAILEQSDVDALPSTPSDLSVDGSGINRPPGSSSFLGSSPLAEHTTTTPVDTRAIPSHPTKYFADSDLTDEVFRPLWAQGEPIVVTGLLDKFGIQWTPDYFLQKYFSQPCLIVECQTDTNKRVTVGEFFTWFGKYEGRTECWKLKDWPSSTEFSTAFPELFEDFSQAVPVPDYVRRDGVLNLASHFPANTVAPDIGPKMYNAMASNENPGSKGSTRLHMDMADALNIMTHAAPCPDGNVGYAAWDLFRAEDADKIRKFLKKKFKNAASNDPIHSQQYYLDVVLRKELFAEYGVKSHRVFQRPGEAVFIPAGCAHQVCNLADCIKVAIDFVSPENISRCEQLTKEFREQNQSMAWKEDVLQLRTMMWFAWLSCNRQASLS
ncbi:hypothetical protein JAAARDRAFT_28691 [Jaapia argillacea MUCL 33604]|uniref:JmjC domain-containing protein n=1 Tax=Jaapia argillacea MUCL 33604 TaxID=933084 RepID=A0A067QFS9_9AGAM|nr:hypothetical protein JAAARDRAFT_28691 [Jaapia argillacea MUCL 33604]